MIAIYLVEKNHFLYCNKKLKGVLGRNYDKFVMDGWDYWYSLVETRELASVKNQISTFLTLPCVQVFLTLKYHITNSCDKIICIKHEIQIHQIEQHILAINYFLDGSEKERIEHCFESDPKPKTPRLPKKQILTISPREKQVLRLIADGYSSKEIADMLYISNHTAITHRKNLIEKFQVKNTAHLVKKASTLICL